MPRIVFQRLERAPPSQGHAHSADNPPPLSQPPGAPCWQVTQTWVLGAWSACLSPLRWPAETKVAWCLWIKWEWGHKQRASGSAPAERNEAQGPWGEGGRVVFTWVLSTCCSWWEVGVGSFEPSGESDGSVALLRRNLCMCVHPRLTRAAAAGSQAPGLSPLVLCLCHVLPLCTVQTGS